MARGKSSTGRERTIQKGPLRKWVDGELELGRRLVILIHCSTHRSRTEGAKVMTRKIEELPANLAAGAATRLAAWVRGNPHLPKVRA